MPVSKFFLPKKICYFTVDNVASYTKSNQCQNIVAGVGVSNVRCCFCSIH
jgi:hypothetical protein